MSLTTYSAEYPDALCVGPEGLKAKLPSLQNVGELKTNGAAAADEVFGYESEFETAYCACAVSSELSLRPGPTELLRALVADLTSPSLLLAQSRRTPTRTSLGCTSRPVR